MERHHDALSELDRYARQVIAARARAASLAGWAALDKDARAARAKRAWVTRRKRKKRKPDTI